MNVAKRLEALEAAAVKTERPEQIEVIRVIVARDCSIVGAMRRVEGGARVPVSMEELEDIRRNR